MIAHDISATGIEGAVDALYANARSYNASCIALPVTKSTNEELWCAVRNRSIGSSTAAGALGVSRYESPYSTWLELSGQVERKDISQVAAVKAGNRLESVVREWFEEETHRRVDVVNAVLVSKAYPFMHTCPDGRVVGEAAGLECKTAGHWAGLSEEWGPSGSTESDAVPLNYLVQCVTSMIVTGWRTWYLAVLIGGNDFRWYTIRYDEELAQQIVAQLRAFSIRVAAAKGYIAAGREIPAEIVPSAKTMDDVFRRWPQSQPSPIEATTEIADVVDEFAKLKGQIAGDSERLDELKLAIASYMGECDTLTLHGVPLCTFKTVKPRETFDAKRHKADAPACHVKYVGTAAPSRMLLLKEAGGK